MAGVVAPAAAEGEVASEAAAAQGEAVAPAPAAEGEAAGADAVSAEAAAAATAAAAAAAAMPLAGLPGMLPGMPGMPALTPEQIQAALMQQQAMLAAMASGQLTGMTPEQMAMMGLPFMGMPFMGAAPGVMAKGVSGGKGSSRDEDDEFTATGRRKRKDTGKTRAQSRSWTDDEERLFLEALQLYGRDWKRCAEHVGTRDHRAFTSHAQKHFIKLLLKGEELPDKVAESGRGYTLSGKPLDPNSAAARAYGLKPDLFIRICNTGKLIVGIHVTTTEMTDGPPPQIQRSGKSKTPSTGGGGGGGKRQRRGKGATDYTSGQETEEEDEEAFLASVQQQAEVTDYVRNRPRRQVGRRTHMGDTTESTDLTELSEFVGPPGTGAANAQPFQVHIDKQALLVMDFHAHLSRCEIIGLLGGAFNAEQRVLEIREAYPCRRAEGQASGEPYSRGG
jgi:protein MYSM1